MLTPVRVEKTEENNYANGLESLYVRGIVDNVSYNLAEESDAKHALFGNTHKQETKCEVLH